MPKSTVEAEMKALEARHRSIVMGFEKQAERLKHDCAAENAKCEDLEVNLGAANKRIADLERELTETTKKAQEVEILYTQARVSHAQVMDDLKDETVRDVNALREQIDALMQQRASLEGDVTVLAKRVQELETTSQTSAVRHAQEADSYEHTVLSLRQRIHDVNVECEALKRLTQQQEAQIKESREKSVAAQEASVLEASKLKCENESLQTKLQNALADGAREKARVEEAKKDLSKAISDLNAERAEALRKDADWRKCCSDLEEKKKQKEDEVQVVLRSLDEKVREMQVKHQDEVLELQRDTHKISLAGKSDVATLQDRLRQTEAAKERVESESSALRDEITVKREREKSLLDTQRELDSRIVKLQMQLSEKDAAITTMQRSLESTSNEVTSVQQERDCALADIEDLKKVCVARDAKIASLDSIVGEARRQENELTEQMLHSKDKLHALVAQLRETEQRLDKQRAELSAVQERHAHECGSLHRDVLAPLQEKVESLVATNKRLHEEVHDRNTRLSEAAGLQSKLSMHEDNLFRQQSELQLKDRRIAAMDDEMRGMKGELQQLQKIAQDRAKEMDKTRQLAEAFESLHKQNAILEASLDKATRELAELRAREAAASADLHAKQSECALLTERNANLESLRLIAEQRASEASEREKMLEAKLEDLKQSYATLQVCFNKQQEQVENTRRLRDQDERMKSIASSAGPTRDF